MQPTSAKKLLSGYEITKDYIISSVTTDSRSVAADSIFVCIKGERADGHDYALQSLQKGARIIIAEHEIEGILPENIVVVKNSLDAMILMGANYRSQFRPVLVGVTGSVGKTTTKEFCFAVFSAFGEALKTEGNQNNEIGMPNTLLRLTDSTKYAVVEMGMQGLGEIKKLTLAAKPCGAIITGIGVSHLQQLKTRDNILKAKMEICDGISDGGVLVVPSDDEYLQRAQIPSYIKKYTFGVDAGADVYAENICQAINETAFQINDKQNGIFSAVIPAIGMHNVKNALSAYTLATRLGLDCAKAAAALSGFKTTGHRQNVVDFNGYCVIEDCYNANPDSMSAALNALSTYPAKRRVAVLGDMFELGDIEKSAHLHMGELCAKYKINYVITLGTAARDISSAAEQGGCKILHCESKQQAVQALKDYCKEKDAVLVKASHGMHFEDILSELYNKGS